MNHNLQNYWFVDEVRKASLDHKGKKPRERFCVGRNILNMWPVIAGSSMNVVFIYFVSQILTVLRWRKIPPEEEEFNGGKGLFK